MLEKIELDHVKKALLHDEQIGLKISASAGAYGVLIEFNCDERTKAASIDVYYGGEAIRKMARARYIDDNGEWVIGDVKIESPGPYFARYGVGITAGGRTLIAMAEYPFAKNGIGHAHIDTDAITPVRPEGMDQTRFGEIVAGVQGAFQTLNIFDGDAPILELEDVNFGFTLNPEKDGSFSVRSTGELVTLYFLATSPKRYGLANKEIGMAGETLWIMRKCMAHGASNIFQPEDYDHSKVDPGHLPHAAAPILAPRIRFHRSRVTRYMKGRLIF